MPSAKLHISDVRASRSVEFAQTWSPEILLKDGEKRRKSLSKDPVYFHRYLNKKSHDDGAEFVS